MLKHPWRVAACSGETWRTASLLSIAQRSARDRCASTAPSRPVLRGLASSTATPDSELAKKIQPGLCPPSGRHWYYTPQEDSALIKLRGDGYSYAAIAAKLPGRSTRSLHDRHQCLRQSGGGHECFAASAAPIRSSKFRKWYTPKEDERILQWHAEPQGLKLSGLARVLGRSAKSVRRRIDEGLTGRSAQCSFAPTAASGRKARVPATPLEAMTVVYLRNKLGMEWRDVAQQVPRRSLVNLRGNYHGTWRPKYRDIVSEDPRKWNHEHHTALSQSSCNRGRPQVGSSPSFRPSPYLIGTAGAGAHMSTWAAPALARQRKPWSQWRRSTDSRYLHVSIILQAWRQYTPEQDLLIREMRAEGNSWSDIGAKVGRTRGGVISRHQRLVQIDNSSYVPIPNRGYSPEEEARIRELAATGCSIHGIGRTVGRSYSSIERKLAFLPEGPSTKTKPAPVVRWSETEDKKMLGMRAKGCTWREIEKTLPDRSIPSIRGRFYTRRKCGLVMHSPSVIQQPWSEADCASLLHMRNVEKLDWKQVASRLERGIPSVAAKYTWLCVKLGTARVSVGSLWTPAEDAVVLDGRAAGKNLVEIAALMGKSLMAVQCRWYKTLSPQAQRTSRRDLNTAQEPTSSSSRGA